MTGIAERTSPALTSRQRTSLRSQLAQDREQTLLLLDNLAKEMVSFVAARQDAPTDDEHDPEGPTIAFERSQSQAMSRQSAQHLADIEAALLRLDDGTYGICTRCSGAIGIGRLQARPQAPLCITCAAKLR
ncbi:MAG: regulatory protein DksA/TraR family [Glaciihabitans sp.]|jgi:RNA polymerase-binding transcription factor DksA|nr:regulatory protein DksA/TraR family [Glaciihabitans sp.]